MGRDAQGGARRGDTARATALAGHVGPGPVREAFISLRVTPRASQDEVGPWRGERLEVRTTAPPVDGRANEAICRLLAAALGVASSRVMMVRGMRGREKSVRVVGVSTAEVLRRLGRSAAARP